MKVVVLGTGYVGLTTGACLAHLGHEVIGCDIDADKIGNLRMGKLPIYEQGLDHLCAAHRDRLRFSTDLARHAPSADVVVLAVGTPMSADGDIDLRAIETAARDVAPLLKSNATIAVKSTVVPGTARRLREIVAEARKGLDFSLASNPEFLREGSAVSDFLCADRIVLGADDPRAADVLRQVYAPLIAQGIPAVETSTVNAELIKYASNAMLAMRIGFINNIADLCEIIDGDVETVSQAVGLDKRIGPGFLKAGPGFGGSCFPKDIRALAALGRNRGARQPLVEALITENDNRQQRLVDRVLDCLGEQPRGRRVAVLGAAFKAGTDDLRESIALVVVEALVKAGAKISLFDPVAARAVSEVFPDVDPAPDPYDAAQGAELALVLTEWPEIAAIDLEHLKAVMAGSTLIDFRNLFDARHARELGLTYFSIGRPLPRSVGPANPDVLVAAE